LHDGIELEKLGIPAVACATDAFKAGLDKLAEMRGMPNYPYALVPHPIGPCPPDELLERARLTAPQIAEIVLRHPDRPAPSTYRRLASHTPDE
jgi:hypothetical protein